MAAGDQLTLFQAEWCPFSSAVRELLTELGLDVALRQVEPQPEQRHELRELAGTDEIPVLQTEDGSLYRGTEEILPYLRGRQSWAFAAEHRQRYAEHRRARERNVPGRLLESLDAG
jgi:glutathione S-transferase